MPKMKSNRGAAKRFKKTGTGKIKRRKGYLRHNLTAKTRKQKRNLRQGAVVDSANERQIARLLPYL
jgi:large subunit ribosomal protein L35